MHNWGGVDFSTIELFLFIGVMCTFYRLDALARELKSLRWDVAQLMEERRKLERDDYDLYPYHNEL